MTPTPEHVGASAGRDKQAVVLEHRADVIAQANANLERMRATMPEPEPKPPPMDPATEKLYEDADW